MKVITLMLSLLSCISISNAQIKDAEPPDRNRIEKIINSQWTFNYFTSPTEDKGYESPGFNDSRWPAISIPHTWNSYETTGELHPFTRSPGETGETYWWTGWGWYRKHFTIDSNLSDHKVFIEFKGVQKYCKLWVNGKYVGDHKGGYGSFDFDITGFINTGGDNLLAVSVSYLQKDEFNAHPLTDGFFNASCGIYRDVILVLTNKLFIPMQGSAIHEGGTLITTQKLSESEGIVNVKTWVKNDYPQSRSCMLQTSISDKNGQVIQILKTEAQIDPGQIYMFRQLSKPLINPHLWTVEEPYLYSVQSEIIDNKTVVDNFTSSFGFRTSHFDEKDNSVSLNGRKVELKILNQHQEYPWLGDAVPHWLIKMDYSDLSGNKSYNFVRTVNYPADKVSFDEADKRGIIAEEDFLAVTGHSFSPEEQKQQLREMIRRDRNHAAIISWSVGDDPGSQENKIFAASEDSTRAVQSVQLSSIPAPAFKTLYNKKTEPDLQTASSGEPAKIVVSSSDNRIPADRASLAIITADITDAKGNRISGAENTISWKVSGPARLVGPDVYVSYADSGRSSEEGFYIEMPATNLIRSNGMPGKIRVTVFSSGLASSSCEIDAEAIKSDNTLITEPLLADAGRKPVLRNTLVSGRLDEIPQEISPVSEDFNLQAADKQEYTSLISDHIKKTNPLIDSSSIEFQTLVTLFGNQLYNNGGILSGADYTYNVKHYNNCRLISGFITKTKLPPPFKESLRKYYSKLIITLGSEKNAGDEMNWLNWIPSGGIVVMIPDEKTITGQKGIIYTKETELTEIIKVVYPQFAKFSEDARERALIFISKMNPDVNVHQVIAGNDGEQQVNPLIYTAEKGVPILIPEYKFISE